MHLRKLEDREKPVVFLSAVLLILIALAMWKPEIIILVGGILFLGAIVVWIGWTVLALIAWVFGR